MEFEKEIIREEQESLDLEKEVEKFEKNSEKLKFLISTIDKLTFPENPLPVEENENIGGVLPDGKIFPFRARYSFSEKDGRVIKENYEVNNVELDKRHLEFGIFLSLAVHEVRHRVQWTKEREKTEFEIFTENDLSDFLGETSEIRSLKNYSKIQRYLEIRKDLAGDSESFDKEIDAMIIGILAEILFKKRKDISTISGFVKSDDKEKILKEIGENKKELLEVISSRIEGNFLYKNGEK
ncbi:hypothetical protein KKE19_01325 [Patescibacteria group bacterium]|nr:hypothetical protein [Patescibacteria group bacterium]MBU4368050.1 hypothetical protein [Patescibacteria group bacterium]MBU4462221.1 hypothetical protein [Patescibacteria group bacterium]MCG2699577.1 hypothetical protein [Candidatus Parcubacteria bacterium]